MERGVFRGNLEEKQCAVFQQVLNGKKSREIAQALQISTKEVDGIIRKTCQQLGVTNRKDAAHTMAAHYRWNTVRGVDYQISNAISDALSADQKKDDHRFRDYNKFNSDQSVQMNRLIAKPELFNALSSVVLSNNFRRILLLIALVVGSSIAIGALVSAMQGFDMLVSSWS